MQIGAKSQCGEVSRCNALALRFCVGQQSIQIWIDYIISEAFHKRIYQLCFSDTIRMSKAGLALKQVLKSYGITQYRISLEMGISRSNIHRWINEQADPAGDAILDIRDALQKIDPAAAEMFIQLYLQNDSH